MSIKVIKINGIEHSLMNEIFTIRQKVFVIEQEVDAEDEYEFEEESTHFLAYYNNIPVGTCRWRQTEKGIKLERFAVLKAYRSMGVGKHLLESALHDIKDRTEKKYLHAQIQVLDFYKKYGFVAVGPEFIECQIRHYKMVLEKND